MRLREPVSTCLPKRNPCDIGPPDTRLHFILEAGKASPPALQKYIEALQPYMDFRLSQTVPEDESPSAGDP
jgi:hypothetical protein